jgi:hypothetical protein
VSFQITNMNPNNSVATLHFLHVKRLHIRSTDSIKNLNLIKNLQYQDSECAVYLCTDRLSGKQKALFSW